MKFKIVERNVGLNARNDIDVLKINQPGVAICALCFFSSGKKTFSRYSR